MHGIHARYLLLFVTLVPSVIALWNKYFVINSNSWRFTNVSRQEQHLQNLECISLCDEITGCTTVNHNSETKVCEILSPGPWIPTAVSQTERNWDVYYKGEKYVPAVDVWQSSTYIHVSSLNHFAYLATDGNRNNSVWENCAHTLDHPSFWAFEFDHVVNVSHVILFFMNNDNYNYRNTNLRLLISGTRYDSDNDIGTDCATYMGPPASPLPPVKVICTQPVTGKFLKIILDLPQQLLLCEVEVFAL